ncbi:ABC transporter substrate-binding protein [Bacillus solitudinis]|uniref:ABC transporter substrate-binding protein n=1 Tax=Bacillus solitudinis TaxID=2014074 RepID=UPI000C24C5F0|nr:extracellular solute-binding protein [Bacillus solitudinis]
MKTVNNLFLMIVTLVMVMTVVACASGTGSGPTENVDNKNNEKKAGEGQTELRIVWWGSQTRHDRTLKAIDLFEEKHPDILVTPEFTGWEGYWERLATQAAGNNLPDLFQMDLQYLNEYVSRDLLIDLEPFVSDGIINFDDVDELYLSGGRVDEQLYAVNLGANSLAVAYDPAMFKEAGIPEFEPGYSWEDFINAAYKIKETFGEDTFMAVPNIDLHGFKHYLRQHDLWLYNENNTGLGYDDDQYFIDYFTKWNELLEEGISPSADVLMEIQGLEDELIVHEMSPVYFPHSNQIVGLQNAAGRPLKLALMPSTSGKTEGHFLKPSQFFSVSNQSDQAEQEAAAKFIDFITNDLEANEILAAERGVPISEEVRSHIYPQLGEYEKMQFDYIELVQEHSTPIHPPEPAGVGEIQGAFERAKEELDYGVITVEEFAKKFREEAEGILGN